MQVQVATWRLVIILSVILILFFSALILESQEDTEVLVEDIESSDHGSIVIKQLLKKVPHVNQTVHSPQVPKVKISWTNSPTKSEGYKVTTTLPYIPSDHEKLESNDNADDVTTMKNWQMKRIERLRQTCDQHPRLKSPNFTDYTNLTVKHFIPHLYVDENNHVIFCFVPKAASHSVRAIVLNNTGRVNVSSKAKHSPWNGGKLEHIGVSKLVTNNSLPIIQEKIQAYFTFMFVRHPLDRLVSAYHDKFLGTEVLYAKIYAQKIKEKYWKLPVNDSNWEKERISFKEYINYMIEPKAVADWHWKTFRTLSHPCVIPYDFIGKVETFSKDSVHLIKHKLSSRGYNNLPSMNGKRKGEGMQTKYEGYRRHLPEYKHLNHEEFGNVLAMFGTDMEMFGYTYERDAKTGEVWAMCEQPGCEW